MCTDSSALPVHVSRSYRPVRSGSEGTQTRIFEVYERSSHHGITLAKPMGSSLHGLFSSTKQGIQARRFIWARKEKEE